MSSATHRILDVLERLAETPDGASLNELARQTGMAKPTLHRLLGELAARGYVRCPAEGVYALTLELSLVGNRVLARLGFLDLCQPALDRLARLSGEMVRLAWRDGDRLVFVAESQGAGPGLRYDDNLGRVAVLHTTATGKCFLAGLEPEQAEALVAAQGLIGSPQGPNAVPRLDALATELARTRQRGYATAYDEGIVGTCAVAAPVLCNGQFRASVAIVAPTARMTRAGLDALAPEVVRCADELARLVPLLPFCEKGRSDPRRIAEGATPP